jgi:hypothetical protein
MYLEVLKLKSLVISPLELSNYFMHHPGLTSEVLRSAHRVHLSVECSCQNKR